ncbi:MAG: ferritin-like domain-containing protein [Polyangiales bacterium]
MKHSARFRAGILAAMGPLLGLGCSDTVATADAGSNDTGATVDTGTPVDTPTVDTPVVVDAGVDTGVDAGPPDTGPVCPGGRAPTRECLTLEQMEARVRNPPQGGGGVTDAGAPVDVPRAQNGCYEARYVQDGCCNPAVAVDREGDTCCYSYCTGACCGRPMTVDGELRAAALTRGSAWVTRPRAAEALDPVTREALAKAWRDDGVMEHASVASFARFTLAMLSLGAPPDIVADAQQAALDEVSHARACLGLAASFDGERLGPGALDVRGAVDDLRPERVLRDLIVEGCVGETVAAMLAAAQRDVATRPEARAALDAIAADEERHSALAWRAAAWMLTERPALSVVAERAFADALAGVTAGEGAPEGVDRGAWRAWGRLDGVERARVTREAVETVVRPCAAALVYREAAGEGAALYA